ncbi:alpha/beta hydrolase family protein [Nocardia sp. CS682]|uniref:alpha/beta hydrolase n=1 Tax=Nocardia sp. CS682 TaxID=1047172 RepID=UPI001F0F1ED9|nr:alpha/beta hydrolase family protein [Nocardia sp. CS682]
MTMYGSGSTPTRRSRRTAWLVAVALAVTAPLVVPPPAGAQAVVDHITQRTDRWQEVFVRSQAMGRIVQLDVLLPADRTASRPTLYLLDGNGSTETQPLSTWTMRTDIVNFFSDKQANVVMPVGGGGTFYTDWLKDDPALGHNKWETFLTEELPPLIDNLLHGNGINAMAGVSMGAQAATTLTFRHPTLYRALAAYSGCLYSSNLGQATVRTVVADKGGNADNMWGGVANPEWPAHDPIRHAEALRGKPIYLSTGTGVPGPYDLAFDPSYSYPTDLPAAIAIEQVAYECTLLFDAKLRLHRIPATIRYTTPGTHSWPYWQDALHDSWPTLRAGLGI